MNVARRAWTNALAKVVLRCKVFLVDVLARARIEFSQFRGLSDWLAGTKKHLSFRVALIRKLLITNLLR